MNARLSASEMEWLERLADARGLTLSGALRYAIRLARTFEMARQDYRARGGADRDPNGASAAWPALLGYDVAIEEVEE